MDKLSKYEKRKRRDERRFRRAHKLIWSRSPTIRAIKEFLFPRAKLRVINHNRIILTPEETENFLKNMGKPVVYNEYLTAILEEHDRTVTRE